MPMYVPALEDLAAAAAGGNPLPIAAGGTGGTTAGAARGNVNGTGRADVLVDTSSAGQTKTAPLTLNRNGSSAVLTLNCNGNAEMLLGRDILTAGDGLRITSNSQGSAVARFQSITGALQFIYLNQNASGGVSAGGVGIGPITVNTEVSAALVAKAINATRPVLIARAASAQTADLFRAEDASQNAMLRVANNGALINTQPQQLSSFTVATLPSAAIAGQISYASNGRVGLEMAGAGTGCPVYSKAGQWMRFDSNTQVQA